MSTSSDPGASALLTDLYQLTMLKSYYERDMHELAVFEFFVRKLPGSRNFFMAAGLEQALTTADPLPAWAQERLAEGRAAQGSGTVGGVANYFAAQPVRPGGLVLLRPKSLTHGRWTPFLCGLPSPAVPGGLLADLFGRRRIFRAGAAVVAIDVDRERLDLAAYRVVDEKGPEHRKTITVEVLAGESLRARGYGGTKKAAEQEAAREALLRLET